MMAFTKDLLSVILLFYSSTGFAQIEQLEEEERQEVRVCVDNNFWYPYSFVYKNGIEGIHVDLARVAIKRAGFEPVFTHASWNTCLSRAKYHEVDAVLSVEHKQAHEEFLVFPNSTNDHNFEKNRLSRVSYYVITARHNSKNEPIHYNFDGQYDNLPLPIRIEKDYEMNLELKEKNIDLKSTSTSLEGLNQLKNSKQGCVITLLDIVRKLEDREEFFGQFKIHGQPIATRNYYLAFSKSSYLNANERQNIWSAFPVLRADKSYKDLMNKKYDIDT